MASKIAIQTMVSGRPNVSTPVAVSSTSDDSLLLQDTSRDNGHEEAQQMEDINNNTENFPLNVNSNNVNNTNYSTQGLEGQNLNNNIIIIKANNVNNDGFSSYVETTPLKQIYKVGNDKSLPPNVGSEQHGDGSRKSCNLSVTAFRKSMPLSIDLVKRDLFASFEENSNDSSTCSLHTDNTTINDSINNTSSIIRHNTTTTVVKNLSSIVPPTFTTINNHVIDSKDAESKENIIKQKNEQNVDGQILFSKSDAESLYEENSNKELNTVKSPDANTITTPSFTDNRLSSEDRRLVMSDIEISSIHLNTSNEANNMLKAIPPTINCPISKPSDSISEITFTNNPNTSHLRNDSTLQTNTSIDVTKSSSYLIPIYIQTSFGQGEIPSIQQAFVINHGNSNTIVPNPSQSFCQSSTGSGFNLSNPKIPDQEVSDSNDPIIKTSVSSQFSARNKDDHNNFIGLSANPQILKGTDNYEQKLPSNIANTNSSVHTMLQLDNNTKDMDSNGIDNIHSQFVSKDIQALRFEQSETGVSMSDSVQEFQYETKEMPRYRFYEESDDEGFQRVPLPVSSFTPRILHPGSCYTSDEEDCHEAEHLTAGSVVPFSGVVWDSEYGNEDYDTDDPMTGPSSAKRCRQETETLAAPVTHRIRNASFSRKSTKDFRPRKVSISYRPIAPKSQNNNDEKVRMLNTEDRNGSFPNLSMPFQYYSETQTESIPRRRCFTLSQNVRRPLRRVDGIFPATVISDNGPDSFSNSQASASPEHPMGNEREVLVARRRCATFSSRDLNCASRRIRRSLSPNPRRMETERDQSASECTEQRSVENISRDNKSMVCSESATMSSSTSFIGSPRKRSSTFSVPMRRPTTSIKAWLAPTHNAQMSPAPHYHHNQRGNRLYSSLDETLDAGPNSLLSKINKPKKAWDEDSVSDSRINHIQISPKLFQRFPKSENKNNNDDNNSMLHRTPINTDHGSHFDDIYVHNKDRFSRQLSYISDEIETISGDIKALPLISIEPVENIQIPSDHSGTVHVSKINNKNTNLNAFENRARHFQIGPSSPLNLSMQKSSIDVLGGNSNAAQNKNNGLFLPVTSNATSCLPSTSAWPHEEMRSRSWSMSSGISSLSLEGSRGMDASCNGDEDVWRPW